MTNPLPGLTKVAAIVRRYPLSATGAAPGCNHAGVPVPVPGPEGVRVAILFTATEPNEATGHRRIRAPSYVLYTRAAAGAFLELRAITPRDLGIKQDPLAWLGDLTQQADPEKTARLLDLYDAALPALAAGPQGLTGAAKRAAGEIRTLFPEVAEPQLLPYYRALGKRFFAWLDRAAA